MVRMMGTFDEWQAKNNASFVSIIDYINEVALSNDSTIKPTISYLLNNNCLNGDLYIHEGYTLQKVTQTGFIELETPNDVLIAIYNKLNTPFNDNLRAIANNFYDPTFAPFKGYYLKRLELPAIESVASSEPQTGKIKANNEPIELSEHQLLMKDYPSFTPHELACFLSDKDPYYINNNNFTDFNLSERLVYKALSNGYLSKNDDDEIKAKQAKEYLYSIGKIYKGFNDNLRPVTADKIGHATITQTMPTDSQLSQQVADLKAQLAKADDTIKRQAKEIADLKAQLEQQANQPCETVLDDEMETKSLNAVSRLVYVLLDMAEYDLSTHSGNGNTSIIARSEKLLQKPLSKKFVSDWIKNAQTARIEYGKK